MSRPPVSVERLSLTTQGQVRYRLKTAYRDGTTDIVLEPLDFIRLEVIASIAEPELIERILAHRRELGEEEALTVSLGARAPPQAFLF